MQYSSGLWAIEDLRVETMEYRDAKRDTDAGDIFLQSKDLVRSMLATLRRYWVSREGHSMR